MVNTDMARHQDVIRQEAEVLISHIQDNVK